jgi:hypothetical protein
VGCIEFAFTATPAFVRAAWASHNPPKFPLKRGTSNLASSLLLVLSILFRSFPPILFSMSQPTSSPAAVVQMAEALLYEQAMVQIQGAWAGTLAAIPPKSAKPDAKAGAIEPDLNYSELFIRDNIPVMIYLLIQGKHDIVRHFLTLCLSLQSQHPPTQGIFPTSFLEEDGKLIADYGQRAIGRVVSVDATLWWVILAHCYVERSGDRAFARQPQVQSSLQSYLDLILRPSFRAAPTLFVPDGAFMIDRPMDVWGTPLEIQVLLYGSLLSAIGLMQLGEGVGSREWGVGAVVEYAHRLRQYVLKQYWVTSTTVQVLRRRPTEEYGEAIENEYNIQTETIPHWLQAWLGEQGGYLIGNVRTGRPDFRFFTLGNSLAAIFDLITAPQQRSLFQLIWQNQADLVAQMPLRICHPPLVGEEWRSQTGYDRKNLPWCYHNAGHWPCLLWFLVVAVLRHQQLHPDADTDLLARMGELMKSGYTLLLEHLPRQNWAEYFDGPTGRWMGQQARHYQTWTIVGFLLVHHLLYVNPEDANILNLPTLKDIRSHADPLG